MQLFVFVCWWASFRLTFESHRRQHSKTTGMSSGRQISRAYRRRSFRERDVRLPVRGLSEMVPSARRAEPEANKEGSHTALKRMDENEKHHGNDRFGTESSRMQSSRCYIVADEAAILADNGKSSGLRGEHVRIAGQREKSI